MKTFREYLKENTSLVDDFLKSKSSTERKSYAKRDNCGPAANDLVDHAKKKGIDLVRVRGEFSADHVVHEKGDFTSDMKREFKETGKDFNNAEHRHDFIVNHNKYKDEWKKVPHYWTKDKRGNIHDPSGHAQLVKTGLSKDLDKSRYIEHNENV